MPVTAELNMSVTGKHTTALDLGTGTFPFALSAAFSLTSGTGAGQVDRVFTDNRSLGPSATENLDLAASLVDAFGATLTFVTVKAIIIRAAVANNAANLLQITRPASNGVPFFMAAGDGIALAPGYVFAWFGSGAGVAVTPTTGDLVTLTNSAGTNTILYDVVILGTSA